MNYGAQPQLWEMDSLMGSLSIDGFPLPQFHPQNQTLRKQNVLNRTVLNILAQPNIDGASHMHEKEKFSLANTLRINNIFANLQTQTQTQTPTQSIHDNERLTKSNHGIYTPLFSKIDEKPMVFVGNKRESLNIKQPQTPQSTKHTKLIPSLSGFNIFRQKVAEMNDDTITHNSHKNDKTSKQTPQSPPTLPLIIKSHSNDSGGALSPETTQIIAKKNNQKFPSMYSNQTKLSTDGIATTSSHMLFSKINNDGLFFVFCFLFSFVFSCSAVSCRVLSCVFVFEKKCIQIY